MTAFALWATLTILAPLVTSGAACLPGRERRGLLFASGLLLPVISACGLWAFSGHDADALHPLFIGALLILPAGVAYLPFKNIGTKITVAAFFYALAWFVVFSSVGGVDGALNLTAFVDESSAPLDFALALEPLSAVFIALVSLLWTPALLYSLDYMEKNEEESVKRFLFFYGASVSAALGLAFAANGYTLFLFYEVLSVCTVPLVTHGRGDDARKSGRIYLGVLLFGSLALLLPGLALIYASSGSLDFVAGGVMKDVAPGVTFGALALCTLGAAKAATMPMHKWLPAAMTAPTPVSALLHAVAVVKAGVFTVIKIVAYLIGTDAVTAAVGELFGGINPLLYLACITALIASIVAWSQDNLKRLLAYSTISQLSYIVGAALLASPKGIQAAAIHMLAHGFGKITLFFAAGAIYTATKKKYLSEMNGLAKTMPYTAAAFTVGALSMIGLPPAAGFWGKWYIFGAAYDAEYYSVIVTLIVSTVLNALYFLPIIRRFYFVVPAESRAEYGEAPPAMLFSLLTAASLALLFFFMPEGFESLTRQLTGASGVTP